LSGFLAANRRAIVWWPTPPIKTAASKKPVHDVVRKSDPVVHQGRLAATALHEERRRLARRTRNRIWM
jgi:hypothetical protein